MKINLLEVLHHHQVQIAPSGHRHVRSGWCGVDCPNCSPRSYKFRLGFNLQSGAASCWICGRMDALVAVATVCRISLRSAAALWDRKPSLQVYHQTPHTGTLALPTAGELLPAHRQYLQDERGFDPDEIQKIWGIQGIGRTGSLQWRILIPIHDSNGRVVSWTTRTISNDPNVPRYISAAPEQESIPHKSILYGAHLTTHSVVVMEGSISAWAVGPGATATCGIGYSIDQLIAISRYPLRAICFDAEPAAQKRAEQLCRDLAPMPGVTENILLESGKDPAECDKEEILEIRKKFL